MAYLPLSTANLPDPVINPAQGASPADHFGTLLWTGNTDTGTRTITDATSGVTGEVNFTPDWVWTKSRSATGSHALFDVVRGANKYLTSNGTGAEITNPSSGYLDSFTDGGFVAQEGSSNFANLNTNGTTYVAWNWKANGSGVTNTDGSITSTVSANTTSGFSIVSFTGDGSSSSTVGHGLNQVPEFIIQKRRDTTNDWQVSFKDVGVGYLNYTDAFTTSGGSNGRLSYTGNTSTTYTWLAGSSTVNSVNASGGTYIAYCFHSVEGFSKFGSYVGNGSTDGPFVYTGFRPSFVLVKRTDASDNWFIIDTARSEINVMGDLIITNDSSAEFTSNHFDFTSNGFKLRNVGAGLNGSGGTFIYMAFADDGGPFKYSLAR